MKFVLIVRNITIEHDIFERTTERRVCSDVACTAATTVRASLNYKHLHFTL